MRVHALAALVAVFWPTGLLDAQIRSIDGAGNHLTQPDMGRANTPLMRRTAVSYADELLERDMGEWSGLTMDEVSEAFPAASRERESNPYHFRPPGGRALSPFW